MGPSGKADVRATPPGRLPPADGRTPARAGAGLTKMPPRRTWLWFLGILLANFLLIQLMKPGAEASITVPYTLFKEEVSKGNVESIYSRGDMLTGRFKKDVTWPSPGEGSAPPKGDRGAASRGPPKTARQFATTLPAFVDPGLEKFLIDNHVEISARPIEEDRRASVQLAA